MIIECVHLGSCAAATIDVRQICPRHGRHAFLLKPFRQVPPDTNQIQHSYFYAREPQTSHFSCLL